MTRTSGVVSSLEEAAVFVSGGLQFPILVIPFGADFSGATCYMVQNGKELSQAIVKSLKASYCQPGRVHLISKAGSSGDWCNTYREFSLYHSL